jgi:hypothetical protein
VSAVMAPYRVLSARMSKTCKKSLRILKVRFVT